MNADIANFERLQALRREFRAEALELLDIARAAGDSRAEAVEWASADTQLAKLAEGIENAGGII